MEIFSSNLDLEKFIAIMIAIENRFRINQTLIEKFLPDLDGKSKQTLLTHAS